MREDSRSLECIAILAIVLSGLPAAAAPTLRYQADVQGDFKWIGNTLGWDCQDGLPDPVVGDVGACGEETDDTGIDVLWRSEQPGEGQALADRSFATGQNRTTAVLALPAGATVVHARLYWSAFRDGADTTAVLEALGTGADPLAVTADDSWTVSTSSTRRFYQATADVTPFIGAWGAGSYRVGGVDMDDPVDVREETNYAAWSLVVVYRDPAEPLRNLAIFDGLDVVSSSGSASATLSGFLVPNAGFDAKLGAITYEGDFGVTGDSLSFGGTALSDGANPSNNFFNGTRSWLGAPVSVPGDLPQMTGGSGSMSGFDLDVVDVTGLLSAGQTSVTIRASTSSDLYLLGAFVTSVSTLKPDFSASGKSVSDLNGDSVGIGDVLEYTVVVSNQGNDPSLDTVLADPLPAGITYVAGSLEILTGPNAGVLTDAAGDDQGEYAAASRTLVVRLGTGADATGGGTLDIGASTSVRFRVTYDGTVPGTIRNQAVVSASGQAGAPMEDWLTDGNGASAGTPPTEIEPDTDGDGLLDRLELEVLGTSPTNPDTDGDGIGDQVETDGGLPVDTDGDTYIDALDVDSDDDGIPDLLEGTVDPDDDDIPAYRDPDDDNDLVPTLDDNCPFDPNADQRDTDLDGQGDACDADDDGDGEPDDTDCAPLDPEVHPGAPDPCDGVDDDCDGVTDDDFVPVTTGCGIGACAREGTTACVGGVVQDTCAPGQPAPSDATCDGNDDDCNGTADEDYVPKDVTCGIGACRRDGTTSCEGGIESDLCVPGLPAPSDATCDGNDDDCNGTADEDFVSIATTCGVGACQREGATSCEGGDVLDSCLPGAPAPSDATCDGVDDDCSGVADEDFVGISTSCGVGMCARTGMTYCEGGGVLDSCVPGPVADETCNGMDDDCDGVNDNGFPDLDEDELADCVDPDDDGDGVDDIEDNCPVDANEDQANLDEDDQGDACDEDDDGDEVPDATDNCPRKPNPLQEDLNDNGIGDACETDWDSDGILNESDNCPWDANEDQANLDGDEQGDACDEDDDGDGVPDATDNCPREKNADQANLDGDGQGDACDGDRDGDHVPNVTDNCPDQANEGQVDLDADGEGDVCDDDWDGDGRKNPVDNCPRVKNPDQADSDRDGKGDACDAADTDGDGIPDDEDNCPAVQNPDQADLDIDGYGDLCDEDDDGDGVPDATDNCPRVRNGSQADDDDNGIGNACEKDGDGDGWLDREDNCPYVANRDQADLDGDGEGDACDADDDGDGFEDFVDNCPMAVNADQQDRDGNGQGDACQVDDLTLTGGSCSATGNATGASPWAMAGLAVLAIGMLAGLRRRRTAGAAAVLAGVLSAVAMLPAAPARAQEVNVQALEVSPFRQDLISVGKGFARQQLEWNVGLMLDFQDDPLVLRSTLKDIEMRKVVSGQLSAHVLGSLAVANFLELGLVLPVVAWQDGLGLPGEASPKTFGVGDLRLHVRLQMFQTKDKVFSIALSPVVTFPTGREIDRYMGASSVTITPWVTAGLEWARGGVAANIGYRPLRHDRIYDLDVGDLLTWRLGGWGGLVPGKLDLIAELDGAVGVQRKLSDANQHPMELRGALRYRPTCMLDVTAGAGGGLTKGYASPDWRVFVGFNVGSCGAPAKDLDRDKDGILDSVDQCPDQPEDKDGYRDEDGCPDPDNDGDGILDVNDKCPNDPEDKDGYQDEDGCPDPDNDGDGILDVNDKCPNAPEDKDGTQDEDGCPDPDNDGDGIPDANDKCPMQPETRNGYQDEDGCPDELAKVEGKKIVILDKIYFDFDKATIQDRSLPVVDAVAKVLKDYPSIERIRIEAHTDLKGSAAYNLKLSKARAASVLKALVERGIDPKRLASQGYGLAKPVVKPEKTDEDAQQNRRVEFNILKGEVPSPAR